MGEVKAIGDLAFERVKPNVSGDLWPIVQTLPVGVVAIGAMLLNDE